MDKLSICVLDLDDIWIYDARNYSNHMVLIAIGRSGKFQLLNIFHYRVLYGVFYKNIE